MVYSDASKCDANGDGVTGLEEAVYALKVVAGLTSDTDEVSEILNEALNEELVHYGLTDDRGYFWSAARRGTAMFYLATEAVNGNIAAENRLFQHINNLLIDGNEPDCTGALSSRGHAQAIGALALVRSKPHLWNKLDFQKQEKLNCLVKGCLIATAATSSDHDTFLSGLAGEGNFKKTWNPNYREGFIGELIASTLFFGITKSVQILESFDCEKYVDEAEKAGLPTMAALFRYGKEPDIKCYDIERVIKNYTYTSPEEKKAYSLYELVPIHQSVTRFTFSGGKIACYVPSDGSGGRLLEGCENLPNKDKEGMLKEFNSTDAGGVRSSLSYSAQGWCNNVITGWLLDYFFGLPIEMDDLNQIGTTDLLYKATHGYHSVANKSTPQESDIDEYETNLSFGFKYARAAMADIVNGARTDKKIYISKKPDVTKLNEGTCYSGKLAWDADNLRWIRQIRVYDSSISEVPEAHPVQDYVKDLQAFGYKGKEDWEAMYWKGFPCP